MTLYSRGGRESHSGYSENIGGGIKTAMTSERSALQYNGTDEDIIADLTKPIQTSKQNSLAKYCN